MRRSIVTFGFIALFFGSFALSLRAGKITDKLGVNRAPAHVAESQPVVKALPKLTPPNAKITAYHFERSVQAVFKEKTTRPMINLDLHGTVFLTELAETAASRLVGVQFELYQGQEKQAHESHLPFVVELAPDQTILSMKAPHAIESFDEDDFNVIKDFVGLYAYGSNRDTGGAYEFKLSKNGTNVEKVKLKYDAATLVQLKVVSSKTAGMIDAKTGLWLKAEGKEQVKMEGMGNAGALVTTSAFKIARLDQKGLKPKYAIASLSALEDVSLAIVSHAGFEVSKWSELKFELQNIKNLSRMQRLSLFHRLSKLLKSDPKGVAEFRTYIESVAKEPGLMTFGIGVLATAGTDSAQEVLRDWYAGGYGAEHTVLNAFSTADAQLTDDTRAFLRNITANRDADPELAQNAVFAMGSSLKHTNDEDARKAVLGYYQGSQTESDRVAALDAIGNSGDMHFIPTLKQAIESGSNSEREKAVFGARFLPADSADAILMAGYQDSSLAVRKASVRALTYQDNLVPHSALIQQCANAGDSTCLGLLKRLNN